MGSLLVQLGPSDKCPRQLSKRPAITDMHPREEGSRPHAGPGRREENKLRQRSQPRPQRSTSCLPVTTFACPFGAAEESARLETWVINLLAEHIGFSGSTPDDE